MLTTKQIGKQISKCTNSVGFSLFFAHAYDVIKVRPIVENHFKSHNIECLGVGGYQDLFRNKLDEDIMRFHSETASAKKLN